MALPLYLAQTLAEMGTNLTFPPHFGYMACHFSPYGAGLSNRPGRLPEGAMLIVNDRTPISGHDRQLITNQLVELVQSHKCGCVLLDFQRAGIAQTRELAEMVCGALPCPVGVSAPYADKLDCPAFLPPVPPDIPLAEYLRPWQGREVWLEAALDGIILTLTENGCHATPLPIGERPDGGQQDERLHCHYIINIEETAKFTLYRSREDLDRLLVEAEQFGVTRAVGLWQELRRT